MKRVIEAYGDKRNASQKRNDYYRDLESLRDYLNISLEKVLNKEEADDEKLEKFLETQKKIDAHTIKQYTSKLF